MTLHLDPDELSACVQCGLCLPHCPTYRVTGDESRSPRGRISLMRAVELDGAPLTAEVVDAFDTCIQCRGCEPACPSSVPYGNLIEAANHAVAATRPTVTRVRRMLLAPLAHPRVLRFGARLLAVAARLGVAPSRLGVPRDLALRPTPHRSSGDDVWLFTGCVMDAWQRDVHQAAQRVLEATGLGVSPTGDAAPCCGALHTHAGLTDPAHARAIHTIAALSGDDRPIVVDSAGCGAAMKDYGRLLATPDAVAFSARVLDIHEFLADRLDLLDDVAALPLRVAVQDPCHLRHVQKAHQATRTVLAPFVDELVETNDDGLCCGAGGAYSVLQPDLARDVRARKVRALEATDAQVVASANPGCSMHLRAGGVDAVHPVVLIDRALAASRR